MSARLSARVRDALNLIAFVRQRGGRAHVRDIKQELGLAAARVRELIETATMAGRAPFGPDDLIDAYIERDWVHVDIALDFGRPIRLSRSEALALAIAMRALMGGGDLGHAAARALDKLRAAMSAGARDAVDAAETRVAFEGDDAGIAGRVARLRDAQRRCRAVDIEYYTASRDAMTRRRVRPYALIQHLGQWYLVGRDSLRRDVRMFKVERIKSVAVTDEAFDVPSGFKVERYRRSGKLLVGRVDEARVRFTGRAARVVREEWPPDSVEDAADGAVVGRLHFAALEGVADWLLAHGGDAEVLEPPELREAVARRARQALALYGDGA
ncbi:MAG: WYL domain-containing protein [Deltaproteobacteria bacterium]|nr:MAG: WYL domain-containing protein [Deltaproteobacteria bacterium]